MKKDTIKPKSPNYRQVPRPLWRIAKQHLPKQERKPGPGRNRKPNRAVMNGLWFILWTGCQWKAVDSTWFGVSSAYCMSDFKPGSSKAFGNRYSPLCYVSIVANDATCVTAHASIRETLQVKFKGHSIADILDMTVVHALSEFSAFPHMMSRLKLLQEVGLGYIKIGQPGTTLSGGEAQRVKLAKELSRRATGKTL